jgi:predicted PurR-regulated permease PerM
MIAVAAISTTGLLILGIPLPYTLGTLAGLSSFVP